MAQLKRENVFTSYAVGLDTLSFSKVDEQSIYDEINRRLDIVEKRYQEGFGRI